MRALFIIFLVCSFGFASTAHNPLSAVFEIIKVQGSWTLKVQVAQAGLDGALKKRYKDVDFSKISTLEYKELTVKYLKQGVDIVVNDSIKIIIGQGGVKLGSHQSNLIFILKGFPKEITSITMEIDCFHHNKGHVNVCRIIDGAKNGKVILNVKNGYKAEFICSDTAITLLKRP